MHELHVDVPDPVWRQAEEANVNAWVDPLCHLPTRRLSLTLHPELILLIDKSFYACNVDVQIQLISVARGVLNLQESRCPVTDLCLLY